MNFGLLIKNTMLSKILLFILVCLIKSLVYLLTSLLNYLESSKKVKSVNKSESEDQQSNKPKIYQSDKIMTQQVPYKLVNVIGDGNCFFRAILIALKLKNLSAFTMEESEHMTLRELVVQTVSSLNVNFDDIMLNEYVNHYEYNGYNGRSLWIKQMSQSGIWADNIAIEACAEFLQIPIEIHSNMKCQQSFGYKYLHIHPITNITNVIVLDLSNGHYQVVV